MKELEAVMRAAMQKYDMIDDGDRIAIGLSGGKDSVAMLNALSSLKNYYPKKFELFALTLDMRFNSEDGDFSDLTALCGRLGVEYLVIRTRLAEIVFEERQEKNPCSLCAKMRRGILDKEAAKLGCNKLALGHHSDDAAATFLMNLLFAGRISCFSPVTFLDRSGITVIRPMIYASEGLIISSVKKDGLPVLKSACPEDKHTDREEASQILKKLDKKSPGIVKKIIGAMEKNRLSGWRE